MSDEMISTLQQHRLAYQVTPIIAVAAALRAQLDKTHQYSFVKLLSMSPSILLVVSS
ncbi:hypothetical protein [Psychrobacter aquimaris]|uniref:hypothetical protein n=1 Tax=Psychrobacter aquimaris TaxID=292733 RepID=UPI0018DF4B2B|nr:hypothetical protein [Psychrobacter aquimaris]